MAKKDYSKLEKADLLKVIEKLESHKRYGLLWDEEKAKEQFEKESENALPVLREVKGKEIKTDPSKPINILIEGDNYHALSVLNYTHRGKVDIIYIDPPYNTGNKDFKYNDNYVDKEDTYRHSKWLSFMSKRLRLAQNLLKDEGMFFCSIDDNELAQLKMLLDEVLGACNFINCISVKTKSSSGASGGGEDKKLKKNVEYLLFYAKNRESFSYLQVYIKVNLMKLIADKKDDSKQFEYKQVLIDEGESSCYTTIEDGAKGDIKIYKHYNHKISTISEITKSEGLTDEEAYFKYFYKIIRFTNAQTSIRSRVAEATKGHDGMFSIKYTPRSGKKRGVETTLYFMGLKKDLLIWLSDVAEKGKSKMYKRDKAGTLWADLSWNGLASEGGVKFENGKKPIAFLKRIMKLYPGKNALILDFFAGSASTAHALLDLNECDSQNRNFILCTNNENNICDQKTYPRIKNAIKGWANKAGLGGNLKYFKTSFVKNSLCQDDLKLQITLECIEMLCLREGIYEELKIKPDYRIFNQNSRIMCVYHALHLDSLALLKKDLDTMKGEKTLYCFTLDPLGLNISDFSDWMDVNLKAIPQPILDIYNDIYNL